MEKEERGILIGNRDDRRYMMVNDNDEQDSMVLGAIAGQSASEDSLQKPMAFEMQDFGDQDADQGNNPTYARIIRKDKRKKKGNWFGSKESNREEDFGSRNDKSKLVTDDDSYV